MTEKKEFDWVYPENSEEREIFVKILNTIIDQFSGYELRKIEEFNKYRPGLGVSENVKVIGEKVTKEEKVNVKMLKEWLNEENNTIFVDSGIGKLKVEVPNEVFMIKIDRFMRGIKD